MTDWLPIIGVIALCLGLAFILTVFIMKAKKKTEEKQVKAPDNLAGFGARTVAFVIDLFVFSWIIYFIRIALPLGTTPIIYLWVVIGWVAYYTASVNYFGTTIGKKILGLKIVSATEKPITVLRIALRAFFLMTFNWLILGSGFLLILIDKNKQGLHDKISYTYVVKVIK